MRRSCKRKRIRMELRMAQQVLPAERWPLFEIRATRMPEEVIRLHIGFDMLIADARSFEILDRDPAEAENHANELGGSKRSSIERTGEPSIDSPRLHSAFRSRSP